MRSINLFLVIIVAWNTFHNSAYEQGNSLLYGNDGTYEEELELIEGTKNDTTENRDDLDTILNTENKPDYLFDESQD